MNDQYEVWWCVSTAIGGGVRTSACGSGHYLTPMDESFLFETRDGETVLAEHVCNRYWFLWGVRG